ncbi:hypothetical protein HMPREF9412_4556 [Paenibacillus sp. HGF5]|nr:hypothetical protein HMPREF9412_4556 [Paenibacillus sp. HGF5]
MNWGSRKIHEPRTLNTSMPHDKPPRAIMEEAAALTLPLK